MVNFIREQTRADTYTPDAAKQLISSVLETPLEKAAWKDEKYLQPVLKEDPLLSVNTYVEDDGEGDSDWSDDDEEVKIWKYHNLKLLGRRIIVSHARTIARRFEKV